MYLLSSVCRDLDRTTSGSVTKKRAYSSVCYSVNQSRGRKIQKKDICLPSTNYGLAADQATQTDTCTVTLGPVLPEMVHDRNNKTKKKKIVEGSGRQVGECDRKHSPHIHQELWRLTRVRIFTICWTEIRHQQLKHSSVFSLLKTQDRWTHLLAGQCSAGLNKGLGVRLSFLPCLQKLNGLDERLQCGHSASCLQTSATQPLLQQTHIQQAVQSGGRDVVGELVEGLFCQRCGQSLMGQGGVEGSQLPQH
ncbi:hypothetical protein INR49_030296 [Caranx melampygus]|nr:hypothetical protein INR49_030296 [Caranx melampygus]